MAMPVDIWGSVSICGEVGVGRRRQDDETRLDWVWEHVEGHECGSGSWRASELTEGWQSPSVKDLLQWFGFG